MEARPRLARSAVVAAAVLAVAVLGLFLRLQEYGPESALRKFHQAIARGSLTDLQRVTAEDVRAPAVQSLARGVASIMVTSNNRFRILRTDRTPNQVRAVVAYTLPQGPPQYVVWVVDRRGRSWRVSVEGTVRVMEDGLGFRPQSPP